MIRMMAAVAVGGALGALARLGVYTWMGRGAADSFPWSTLVVNVSGSLFLGITLRVLTDAPAGSLLRSFLAVGVAGAFTTFSTFSHDGILLLQAREYGRAATYLGGSVVLGLAAVLAGFGLAGLIAPGRG